MTVSSIATGYDGISLLAGNAAYDPAGTFLIQRVAGTGSAGTISFTSIPQTYKHLQIRSIARDTYNDGSSILLDLQMQFNGDTGSNYTKHILTGTGSSATASGSASRTSMEVAAMVRVVNHLEIKNPAIAPDLNVGLAGVVEDCGKAEQDVRFLVLNDGCFVVAVAEDQQEVRIGSEPFNGCVNDGVKVSPVVMLWTNVVLAPARVALALHQTKKVPIYEDFRTPASCFFDRLN